MTLYQPINQRWVEERGENWSHGELVDDGIVKRSATVEATTRLGRRALRIIEALHGAHPLNELETPERGTSYELVNGTPPVDAVGAEVDRLLTGA